ncbi:hypothetical protein Vafri_8042, partial [Volvox africanus]
VATATVAATAVAPVATATVAATAVAPVATATVAATAVAPVATATTTAAGSDGVVASLPTGVTVSVSAPGGAPPERRGTAVKAATVPSASGVVTASSTTVARGITATVTSAATAPPLAPTASTAAPTAAKSPVEIKRPAGSPTSSPPPFGGFSTVGGVKAASPSFGYLTISHHRFDDIVTCAPPPPTPSTPPPQQAAAVSSSSAAPSAAAAPPPGVHVLSGETVSGLKLTATQSRPKVPSPGPSLDISEPPAQQLPAAPASVASVAAAGAGVSGTCGGGAAASNPVSKPTSAVNVAVAATTPNVITKTSHIGSAPGSGGAGGAKSIPTAPAAAGGAPATKTSSASPSARGLSRIPSFSTPNATTPSSSLSRPGSAERADKALLSAGGGSKSRSSSPSSAQAFTTTSIPSVTKSGCTAATSATATRPDSQRRPALGHAVTNVAVAATATANANATAAPVAVSAAPVATGGTTCSASTTAAISAAISAATAGATSPLSESRLVTSSSSNSSDLTGISLNLPSYDSGTTIAYIMPKSAHGKAGAAPAPAGAGAGADCAVTEKGSVVVGVLYPTPGGGGQLTAPMAIPAQTSTGGLQERRRYTSSPSVTGTRISSPLTTEVESDASPRLGLPPNNTFQPSSSVGRRFSISCFSLPISSDISGDGDGDGDVNGGSDDNGDSTPCSVQQQTKPSFQFYHNPHFDSGVGAAISAASKSAVADGDVKGLHQSHQTIINVTDVLSRQHRRSSTPPGLPEDAVEVREKFTEVANVPGVALTGGDKIRTIQAAASAAGIMGGSGAAAAVAAAANRLRSSNSRREQADAEAFCLYGGLALTGDSSDSENV